MDLSPPSDLFCKLMVMAGASAKSSDFAICVPMGLAPFGF